MGGYEKYKVGALSGGAEWIKSPILGCDRVSISTCGSNSDPCLADCNEHPVFKSAHRDHDASSYSTDVDNCICSADAEPLDCGMRGRRSGSNGAPHNGDCESVPSCHDFSNVRCVSPLQSWNDRSQLPKLGFDTDTECGESGDLSVIEGMQAEAFTKDCESVPLSDPGESKAIPTVDCESFFPKNKIGQAAGAGAEQIFHDMDILRIDMYQAMQAGDVCLIDSLLKQSAVLKQQLAQAYGMKA